MQKSEPKLHALIYNRVSSTQQESEGSGLKSQEQRCIKYAESKNYIVDEKLIFHDTFTGGGDFMRRPAMRDLLNYIDNHVGSKYVVIFDDLKRFARDTKFHIELRSAFNTRKVKVECLNFNFEDTPEGNFVETILAAQNQLEREQNKRQVVQKQKARLESGYWAFHAHKGYKMKKTNGSLGKIAVPDENAPSIKEALEGFATRRFIYITDVVNFLKNNQVLGSASSSKYIASVKKILTDCFYAGFVEYQPWNVTKRQGVHEPLIDESMYFKNLERLNKPVHLSRVRVDDNLEFEVRRLINCIHCKRPFTGAFSKGRNQRYPYYLCQTKGCLMYRKAAARDFLHKDFEKALYRLEPKVEVINMFKDLFEETWKDVTRNSDQYKLAISIKIKENEEQVERFLNIVCSTKSDTIRYRCEDKIEHLQREIKSLEQKKVITIDLSMPYQTALEKVITLAKSPYNSWCLANLSEKKKLFYFFFEDNIEYDLKNRYQTVKPTILYRFFDDLSRKSIDVDTKRNFSNQLSDVIKFINAWSTAP